SNRERMMTHITFQKENDPDKGLYICDDELLSIPEITELYETFDALNRQYYDSQKEYDSRWMDSVGWPELKIDSAYIDRETRRMIPHTGSVTVRTDEPDNNNPMTNAERTVKTFEITVDDDAYELVELHRGSPSEVYPHTMMTGFYGTESDTFHELTKDWINLNTNGDIYTRIQGHAENLEYSRSVPLRINNQNYYLTVHFFVNPNDPVLMQHFRNTVIAVALLLIAIALLWSWRKNVVNKAKYAFEDYQRDLTNSRAHDIKTPLTAIGGYAENILDGKLSEDEQQQYLKSILDNVSFTDSLISRTLFLNSMDAAQKPKPEKIKAEQITESILKKYELLISEHGIGYSVQGEAAITADRAALETVIENLVSNAVKYTPRGGKIRAQLDKKRLTLANTVAKKISVKELKRPFTRGDEARSNTDGTGLGLTIAERAAQANGWKLTLSCTDKDFIAELKW
ncbi:MAG: HAMP domain-containing histidine kinase, partial [Oscillospiraceae bacterium]|nr:HAMP domain-containing histidine kinase [Oscillospiraceae bacterium]